MAVKTRRVPSSPADIADILKRQVWWIIVPFLVVGGGTAIGVHFVPKEYQSKTTIMVDPQKIPQDYVKSTVSTDLGTRLEDIKEKILSRAKLAQILQQFGLYSAQRQSGKTEEDLVNLMFDDIDVQIITNAEGSGGQGKVGGFRISYTGASPLLAQQIDQQLASLFIQENITARTEQAMGTKSFIDSQLDQASKDLQKATADLTQLETQHMGELPTQEGQNVAMMQTIRGQIQSSNDRIVADQGQVEQETELLQAIAPSGTTTPQAQISPLQGQLDKAETDLAEAEKKFTPNYPDVQKLQSEVDALKQEVATEDARQKGLAEQGVTKSGGVDQATQMRISINGLKDDMTQRQKAIDDLEKREKDLEQRLGTMPQVEQIMVSAQRQYDLARENYQSLQKMQISAGMSAAMESNAQGEEFQIVDPPNLPQSPSSPHVLVADILGAACGLVIGILLAGLSEINDPRVYNERDIFYYLGQTPWAMVPELTTQSLRQTRRGWKLRRGSSKADAAA